MPGMKNKSDHSRGYKDDHQPGEIQLKASAMVLRVAVSLAIAVSGQYFSDPFQVTRGIDTMTGHFTCHFDMYFHAMP